MVTPEKLLIERLAPAFAQVAGMPADPSIRRGRHADFQCDGALALGRRLGRDAREIAAEVLRYAVLDDLCSAVEISGPGFVNLTLAPTGLGRLLAEIAADERLGVPRTARPETIVVDYSGPNTAKEMHVGHLRSTIIGDAAVRVLEWQGHTVLRRNHLGDWGTPFGMLIEHLLDVGETEAAHELSVGDLTGFYQAARRAFDADEAFRVRSRERVVALQAGDPTTLRLWRVLVSESKKYFMAVYARLGVRLTADDFFGESHYNDELPPLVEELTALGLLRESAGAQCVFPAGFVNRDGEPLPLIVRKSDGGFGYAATDLATLRHRLRDLAADRLLYVVGTPQSEHLEMVFATARDAGWHRATACDASGPGATARDAVRATAAARVEHVEFGYVLGSDGKILRTRAGASVKLVDLLDEAVARAAAVIAEKNPDLDADARAAVARAVGIGAVKYADLSGDRRKDYRFDYDRMLSLDGNTAPYLQYAHARTRSILRRGGVEAPQPIEPLVIGEPAERALALRLLAFPDVIEEVGESLDFHRLALHLFELATAFTGFFENCPVLRSEGETRYSRLILCDLTARTLARGLDLLGIETPDRM
ncbi:arginine--tRNA ligase [Embleya scabrispora]|uniref:arginine--tRNA ligase n=1 Tax=Embleya scabrispora TaxID=159449 RepID=UPI00036676B4|nr:arginine--tRNA ligase [Embleya scabrispora]MYS82652.1 arginine--tRNA ligase [Streptomyces sp. SID5474]